MVRVIGFFVFFIGTFSASAANSFVGVEEYAKASFKVEFNQSTKMATVAYKLSGSDSLKAAINSAYAVSDDLISGSEPKGYTQVSRSVSTKTQGRGDLFVIVKTHYRSELTKVKTGTNIAKLLNNLQLQKVQVVASVLDNSYTF